MIDQINNNEINLITNNYQKSFYHELKESFKTCKTFYISVAFINSSALGLFKEEFTAFSEYRNGKIITTNYMYGTDPNALSLLVNQEYIETRVFDVVKEHSGFHTKGYIFEMEDHYKVYIGSSNLTQSALKTNKEWNLRIISKDDSLIRIFLNEFNELWYQSKKLDAKFIAKYRDAYFQKNDFKKSNMYEKIIAFIKQSEGYEFVKDLTDFLDVDKNELIEKINNEIKSEISPNVMQEEACERLQLFRNNFENKALVISATGTGKTFMAAFDVSQFQAKRVLFIVHREKILKDAMNTFKMIMPEKKMGIVSGNNKEFSKEYIFSTNFMMGKKENLDKFSKDYFDYIIIDEAHRLAGSTYQNILSYFTPKFLLGMTATPERTDNFSIYDYFDHNIAVEYRLRDALKNKLVVPFQYYGIEDVTTDLSNIKMQDTEKLTKALSINKRINLIIEELDHYPYNGKKRKTLGFCASIEHAEYMESEFNLRGLTSIALTGKNSEEERELAISRIADNYDPLAFIFTVDIFNEGIDIPSINTILMLRPTESPIIFTQQLGRGLRNYDYKEFLIVLDFIGNHNKNFLLPIALYGDSTVDKDELISSVENDFFDIPGDVFIRLQQQTKERILQQLENTNFNAMPYLKESYLYMFNNYKMIDKQADYLPMNKIITEEFNPVRFIKSGTKKTYLNFINSIHKNKNLEMILQDIDKVNLIKTLEFRLPIINPVMYITIKFAILSQNLDEIEILKEARKYNLNIQNSDVMYAFRYLAGEFYNSKGNYLTVFLEKYNNRYFLKNECNLLINNDTVFKQYLLEILEYGLNRYFEEFNKVVLYDGFKLYHQYSYYDVALTIRYNKAIAAFAMSGILPYGNDYYLFVNLKKEEVRESINYKDYFINNKTFHWESPSATPSHSNVAHRLRNHKNLGVKIHLFVRKNKTEDKLIQGFYYFGKLNYISDESEKPIKFNFELEHRIPDSKYPKFIVPHEENQ